MNNIYGVYGNEESDERDWEIDDFEPVAFCLRTLDPTQFTCNLYILYCLKQSGRFESRDYISWLPCPLCNSLVETLTWVKNDVKYSPRINRVYFFVYSTHNYPLSVKRQSPPMATISYKR